jgi:hypothetical protein
MRGDYMESGYWSTPLPESKAITRITWLPRTCRSESAHVVSRSSRDLSYWAIRDSFALLGRMLGIDILRPGPSPSSAATQSSWDVFSHASEYDVAERQRPVTQHTEVAM